MRTYNTTLYSKEFQRNYKNRKDMNSIINANVKDHVNKSESLIKTANILRQSIPINKPIPDSVINYWK